MKIFGRKAPVVFAFAVVAVPCMLSAALSWFTKTSMPTERYDMCTGTVQGVIYVIGGDPGSLVPISTVEAYDPSADTAGGTPWTTKWSMPYSMHRLAAAVIDDTIYTCGGWYGMGVKAYTLEYDPFSDWWVRKSDMPAVRQYHTAASIGGKMYAIGGSGPVNTCFEYDQATDSWTTKTAMPTARYALASAAVGGKVYVIGGEGGSGVLGTVEEYDPTADTVGGSPWATKTSMPTARRFLSCCVKVDTIYAIGGVDGSKAYHNTVEKYVPATDTWYSETAMPTARRAPISSVVNGIIYVIGGDNGDELDTTEAAESATAIELTSFNAIGERGGVVISWSTALETGVVRWIVERSVGGSYETIATFDAGMESPLPNSYRYFDATAQPEIHNLYRLGDQDKDNTITWYGPVSATPIPSDGTTLLITPNPSTREVRIQISKIRENHTDINLEIFDVSGRRVREISPFPFNFSLAVTWDGRDEAGKAAPPGIYFIKLVVNANTIKAVKKVTLIK
jgi:hypothetical protein